MNSFEGLPQLVHGYFINERKKANARLASCFTIFKAFLFLCRLGLSQLRANVLLGRLVEGIR